MGDFERLGLFYLGRPYDLELRQARPGFTLYDSRDLVTHAVCVGMTGSGKTGLCLSLLEEAAIDGVPAIAIDPKGDLGNLLLTFPGLSEAEFAPWVSEEEARRQNLSREAFAASQADRWRRGLAEWGQDGARIQRLRDAADFAIYTPGSEAGLSLSVLRSFAAPAPAIRTDPELLRERVVGTVTSLLTLVGLDADPLRSRDHILLSTILANAWSAGRDVEVGGLIRSIQSPPVDRIGIMDLETFYPAKDRFALAMTLNNLLAAPGFAAWLEGEPLDVAGLLHTPEGRPRVSIVSIAHLSEPERMFVVSLVLGEVVAWMRAQPGTTSLRAVIYMDEIAGYFPPVATPASKAPLLTLLKQGRAFGLGVVLASQNPVDLDYKGLANAGTWFLGRLQTERDKARVLDGLEGASAGGQFDRSAMERTLAGLGARVFLLHNVHDDGPEVFETRWALCYLRGPLMRPEIRRLMEGRRNVGVTAGPAEAAPGETTASPAEAASPSRRALDARPVVPPDLPQYFAPVRRAAPSGSALVYAPRVFGSARIRYLDTRLGIDHATTVSVLDVIEDRPVPVDWRTATPAPFEPRDLQREAAGDARYLPLPVAVRAKSLDAWTRTFTAWLTDARPLALLRAPDLKATSAPGENERAFRIRLGQLARERRDEMLDALRRKYAPKMAALEQRLHRASQALAREEDQATEQKVQTAISFGTTLLGAMLGRRSVSTRTLGGARTAARGVGRSMKEAGDVARARETIAAVRAEIAAVDARLREESAAVEASVSPDAIVLAPLALTPKRSNVTVELVSLVWVPSWEDDSGNRAAAV